ncbi:MAG: Hsp20/alpha crystallin family protein [Nitrospira sp.]|jgi:HSP20 family protein|nr:Hsp20/alpha crystallin family protein [Nitrospira sp. BO4]
MSWENQLPVLFPNRSVESQIDHLLDDAIQSVNGWSQSWNPACDIFENEEGFTVQLALPGLEANQIAVQVESNILRVKGERKRNESEGRRWYLQGIGAGAFSCVFNLPEYADHEKSMASYKQGLLTITFPKREQAKPRSIMIECE